MNSSKASLKTTAIEGLQLPLPGFVTYHEDHQKRRFYKVTGISQGRFEIRLKRTPYNAK